MSEQRVFVAYPDHEMSLDESQFYADFVSDLNAQGYLVSVRPNARNSTGIQINEAVAHALGRSVCLIAFVDRQSTSVGVYIAFALSRSIPILCLHNAGKTVTRTISGLDEQSEEGFPGWGKLTLKTYQSERDVARIALDFLKCE